MKNKNENENESMHYPHLSDAYPLHERIRESIVRMLFHCCRQEIQVGTAIEQSFRGVLDLVRHGKNDDECYPYITLLAKITLFCRDCRKGKGERHVVYALLFVWYEYDPNMFQQLFRLIINSYGGWRDAVGVASYAHMHLNQKIAESLVAFCVEQINAQLKEDSLMEDPSKCSNVAKWIPRENKKDGWLFPLLVKHWDTLGHDMGRAYSHKCKFYRQLCSKLNRAIGTFEIRLTDSSNRDWMTDFSPPIQAFVQYSKQRSLVLHDVEPVCRDHLVRSQYSCSEPGRLVSELHRIYFSAGSFNRSVQLDTVLHYSSRVDGINAVWRRDMKFAQESILESSHKKNILVVLDTGFSMSEQNRLNDAIGIACSLVEVSNIRRILTIGHLPSWISLNEHTEFAQMVNTVFENIGPSSSKHIQKTFDLLTSAFHGSNLTEKEVSNLVVVYLSDMEIGYEPGEEDEDRSIHSIVSSAFRKKYMASPHIVYWGIRVKETTPLPCPYDCNGATIVSGENIGIMRMLRGLGGSSTKESFGKHFNPYSSLCYHMNNYFV